MPHCLPPTPAAKSQAPPLSTAGQRTSCSPIDPLHTPYSTPTHLLPPYSMPTHLPPPYSMPTHLLQPFFSSDKGFTDDAFQGFFLTRGVGSSKLGGGQGGRGAG